MTASLTFLTPRGAVVAVAILLPLAGLLLAERRVDAVRVRLGLRRPFGASQRVLIGALAGVPLLLALAATQPALRTQRGSTVRTDAEAFFVIDTSRSMLAAAKAGAPTRLQRAKQLAVDIRAAIPTVPAGVATFTDRVLPDLFPTADAAAFDSTLRDAVAVDQPPPEEVDVTATTFDRLADVATQGFFAPSVRKRLVVVLTDGESRPFASPGRALRSHGVKLLLVHVSRAGERIFRSGGKAEATYRPDPASGAVLRQLAAAAGGRAVSEADTAAASDTIRSFAGSGPTRTQGTDSRTHSLAPYVAAASIVPLLLVLRRRNLG
jgi:hypothetical protein